MAAIEGLAIHEVLQIFLVRAMGLYHGMMIVYSSSMNKTTWGTLRNEPSKTWKIHSDWGRGTQIHNCLSHTINCQHYYNGYIFAWWAYIISQQKFHPSLDPGEPYFCGILVPWTKIFRIGIPLTCLPKYTIQGWEKHKNKYGEAMSVTKTAYVQTQ